MNEGLEKALLKKCFKEGWVSNSKEDDLSGFTIWECVLFTPHWSIDDTYFGGSDDPP